MQSSDKLVGYGVDTLVLNVRYADQDFQPVQRELAEELSNERYYAAPLSLSDVEEAAAWPKISRAKLFELMHEHDFPVVLITDKLIRFDPNSLLSVGFKKTEDR